MSTFWRVVWIVARKDLAIEARSRELLNTTSVENVHPTGQVGGPRDLRTASKASGA